MTPDGAEGSPRDGAETNILGTTNTVKDPSALPKGMTAATCADLPDECESLAKQQQAHGKFQSNIGKGVDIVDKVATTVVTEAVNPVNYIPGVVELRAAKNVERVAEVANDARLASKAEDAAEGARVISGAVYKTTKEATAAAEKLGFTRINETVNGQAVYQEGRRFISRDVDGHNGGVWKMADSVKSLGSKNTRMGTYDADLKKIGE